MEYTINECLSNLKEKYNQYFYHYPTEFHYLIFDQKWGSTALGLNTVGGTTITKAPTFVFQHYDKDMLFYDVFFGGTYAYSCRYDNENFCSDLKKRQLKNISKAEESYNAFFYDELKLQEMIYFEEKKQKREKEKETD